MRLLPVILLLFVVLACAGGQRYSDRRPAATPNLPASRRLFCDIIKEQFQQYALSCEVDGPDQKRLTIRHAQKSMLLMADAMMLSKPEFMQLLRERQFESIRFTDGKKYSRTIPVR